MRSFYSHHYISCCPIRRQKDQLCHTKLRPSASSFYLVIRCTGFVFSRVKDNLDAYSVEKNGSYVILIITSLLVFTGGGNEHFIPNS